MCDHGNYWGYLNSSRACGTLFTGSVIERLTWNPKTQQSFFRDLKKRQKARSNPPQTMQQKRSIIKFKRLIAECLVQVDEQGWEHNRSRELTFKVLNPARTKDRDLKVGWAIAPGRFLGRILSPRRGLIIKTSPVPFTPPRADRRGLGKFELRKEHLNLFNRTLNDLYDWTARLAYLYDQFSPEDRPEHNKNQSSEFRLFVEHACSPTVFNSDARRELKNRAQELGAVLAELHCRLESMELATKYVYFLGLKFPDGQQCKDFNLTIERGGMTEQQVKAYKADVKAFSKFLDQNGYFAKLFPKGCPGGDVHRRGRKYLAIAIQEHGFKLSGDDDSMKDLRCRLDSLTSALAEEVKFTVKLLERQFQIRQARKQVLEAFEYELPEFYNLADQTLNQPYVSIKRLISGKAYRPEDANTETDEDDSGYESTDIDEDEDSESGYESTDIDEAIKEHFAYQDEDEDLVILSEEEFDSETEAGSNKDIPLSGETIDWDQEEEEEEDEVIFQTEYEIFAAGHYNSDQLTFRPPY